MKNWAMVLIPVLTVGCSTSSVKIPEIMSEAPRLNKTSLTHAYQCVRGNLNAQKPKTVYAFIIKKLDDATVRGSLTDGPLSDAGKIELQSSLTQLVPHSNGVVLDIYPEIFQPMSKTRSREGLNIFGKTRKEGLYEFKNQFLESIKYQNNSVKTLVPLIIDGSFTQLDSDRKYQKGNGLNIGSDGKDDGEINIGKTTSAKAISLTVNLILPSNNTIISSKSFSINAIRKNNKFKIKLGLGEGFIGYTREELTVEGLHGAQKTLVDAAALWIASQAFSKHAGVGACLTDSQKGILAELK